MFCQKCGKQIAENSQFCQGCGTPFGSTDEAPDPAKAPAAGSARGNVICQPARTLDKPDFVMI
ncbi:MAG: zinc-ribbon domain-containing protein [Oscillospiraceae bacterium]|nr:zinc-ribbon domain-containing protein [Oscillospiraceae bacterium]